jgi:hypothetical protein
MAEEILRIAPDQVKKLIKQDKIKIVSPAPVVDTRPESGSSLEFSQRLFGRDFFGPNEVGHTFGVKVPPENTPQIPFSQEQLEVAKALDQKLILRVNKAADGQPLTMRKMGQILQPMFDQEGNGKILYNTDWYKGEGFFTKETPVFGWALAGKEVLPSTLGINYFDQTQALASHIKTTLFASGVFPPNYQVALDEFVAQEANIAKLINSNKEEAAKKLAGLQINQLMRQSAPEVLYDLLMTFRGSGERELKSTYTWTNTRASDGGLVVVGSFDSLGVLVPSRWPGYSDPRVGVCPSR